jgi:hypothetical protein
MTETAALLRLTGMARAKRVDERSALAYLLTNGYARTGAPKVWVSQVKGFEEFTWTYANEAGDIATFKTRHPLGSED